jgi:hypothetical protein
MKSQAKRLARVNNYLDKRKERGASGGSLKLIAGRLASNSKAANDRSRSADKRVAQFNKLALDLVVGIRFQEKQLKPDVTVSELKNENRQMFQLAQDMLDSAQALDKKTEIAKEKKKFAEVKKRLKSAADKQFAKEFIEKNQKYIDRLTNDFDGYKAQKVNTARRLRDKYQSIWLKSNYEKLAAIKNKEIRAENASLRSKIDRDRARLQKAYDALKKLGVPANAPISAYKALGVKPTGDHRVDFTRAQKSYRELAKANHPDVGGSPVKFRKINAEWEKIKKYRPGGRSKPPLREDLFDELESVGIRL